MSEGHTESLNEEAAPVGALQRITGGNSGTTSEDAKPGEMALGLAVLGVGAILLWLLGSWLFRAIFGEGSGLLYELVSGIVVIALLASGLGVLVPLPFFFGSRIVALIVGLLLMFFAIPFSQSLRTPEQVAAEEGSNSVTSTASDDAAYSDTAVQAAAMSRVKDKLVDPGSARFRNVEVVPQPSGTKAVCGEVNAKNRAGGYSGYEHFISAGTAEFTWLESQVPDFATAWNQVCVR